MHLATYVGSSYVCKVRLDEVGLRSKTNAGLSMSKLDVHNQLFKSDHQCVRDYLHLMYGLQMLFLRCWMNLTASSNISPKMSLLGICSRKLLKAS